MSTLYLYTRPGMQALISPQTTVMWQLRWTHVPYRIKYRLAHRQKATICTECCCFPQYSLPQIRPHHSNLLSVLHKLLVSQSFFAHLCTRTVSYLHSRFSNSLHTVAITWPAPNSLIFLGLAIRRSRVRVPLWPLAGFVLGRPEFPLGHACK